MNIRTIDLIIRLDMLERTETLENPEEYKFILNIDYLKEEYGNLPQITVTDGIVSSNTIIWDYNLSGRDVSFQYKNSKNRLITTFVYLKNYNYVIDDKGTITKYTPIDTTTTQLDIPMIINEIEVKKIGYGVFYACSGLKIIEIPISVKSIEKYALAYCRSLEIINIPNKVTSLSIVATSDEIDPDKTKSQLLDIWTNFATNLSLSTDKSEKFIIIGDVVKDLS